MASAAPPQPDPAVGLCSVCRHGSLQASAKAGGSSRFWRCLRAARERAYRRYPELPVERCPGYEAAPPAEPPQSGPRDHKPETPWPAKSA